MASSVREMSVSRGSRRATVLARVDAACRERPFGFSRFALCLALLSAGIALGPALPALADLAATGVAPRAASDRRFSPSPQSSRPSKAAWTRGYPPRITREDAAVCGWMHRWPDAASAAVAAKVTEIGEAIDAEFGTQLREIEARLGAALGEADGARPSASADARAAAFRDREVLADRMLAREAQLLSEALVKQGLGEDDVFLVSSTLAEHRRSILGQQCAPLLAGAGDCDVRPILWRFAEECADVDERARLRELASETLPNLGSLFNERRRIARRVVPESTQLFERMRTAATPQERQALRAERESLRRPQAGVERRIVESSLLAMQRFREGASGERGELARRSVLEAMFGPLASDPWDPATLVALAAELAAADETLSQASAQAAELAESQKAEREERQRQALAAVIRFWFEFGTSMSAAPDETERLMKALDRWHASSAALSEPIAALIERDAPAALAEAARAKISRWRERAETTAEAQRQSFSFAQPRFR